MALVDDVTIKVKAGNGGNGGVATKQLYGTKKTAPDGGNGGRGGNVFFKGDSNISDLSEFMFKKHIKAHDGVNGLNKDLDGAKGEDVYVAVPFGTTITDMATGEWVEILTEDPFCVAYGGRGGIGNHDYKLDLKRPIYHSTEGEKGEERELHLVLNLIANIGIVGLPNAGKSSLLKALTNAVPKIGNYPFTTLEPNLGALNTQSQPSRVGGKHIILADIPGLIEGASQGKGLGFNFLKHIKKTTVLLHAIDATSDDIAAAYNTVKDEFDAFDKSILDKQELLLLTKADLLSEKELKEKVKQGKKINKEVLPVSIYETSSLEKLRSKLLTFV